MHFFMSAFVVFWKKYFEHIGRYYIAITTSVYFIGIFDNFLFLTLSNFYRSYAMVVEKLSILPLGIPFLMPLCHHCHGTFDEMLYAFWSHSLSAPVCFCCCIPFQGGWCIHFLQSFLNARHLWGLYIVLQYLHFCRGLFFIFVGYFFSSRLCFAFF